MSVNFSMLLAIKICLRKFGKFIATFFLIIAASASLIWGITKFFTIRTIEVEGSGMQVVVDQKRLTKNLLFFPTEQLRTQLLSDNPLIGDVLIKKKFPHTLTVAAFPRVPVGLLKTSGRFLHVDKECIVIGEGIENSVLPLLVFDPPAGGPVVRIGEKIRDERICQSIAVIIAFGGMTKIDAVTTLDSQSLQVKSGKLYIYITQQVNASEVAATLQTLLGGFRIKGTLPAIIDLRFSKPIISF